MDMQNVSNLEIPEGEVKTIHDKDHRLLWGAVGYDTTYRGGTTQQTYQGYNLVDLVPITNSAVTFSQECTTEIITDATLNRDVLHVTATGRYPALRFKLPSRLESGKYYELKFTYRSSVTGGNSFSRVMWFGPNWNWNEWDILNTIDATRCKSGDGDTSLNVDASTAWKTTSRRFYVDPTQYSSYSASYASIIFSLAYGIGYDNITDKQLWLADAQLSEITQSEWDANNYTSPPYEPYVGSTPTQITPAPNPDYPQDIQVVTGEQTVKVTGKNLFNSYIATKPYWQSGTLVVNSDGTFTVSGNTGSNNYFQLNQTLGTLCPNLKVGDTAYLFLDTTNANKRIYIGETWFGGSSKTITQAMLNAAVVIYGGYNQTDTIKMMVTEAPETTYESFQSQDYTVNLQGKNLLQNNATTQNISGVDFTVNPDGTITVDGTASAQIIYNINTGVNLTGTYTLSGCPSGGSDTTYKLQLYGTGGVDDMGSGNITTNPNGTVRIVIRNGVQVDNLVFKPMLESGNQPTTYAPYYNYELAKIGTYQDYIYKSGDDWYVHKATNKIQFNGSESVYNLTSFGDIYQFYVTNYQSQIAGLPQTLDVSYSTHFSFAGVLQSYGYANAIFFNKSGGTTISNGNISFSVHTPTTPADFKTWLGNNRPVLYHPLATPTDTKITDATLISQLNAIHEWLTRYGYYGTVSGNLPMIIDRTNL